MIVLHKTKVEAFHLESIALMQEYYAIFDAAEEKRKPEAARSRYAEVKEKSGDGFSNFVSKYELMDLTVPAKILAFDEHTKKTNRNRLEQAQKLSDQEKRVVEEELKVYEEDRQSEREELTPTWQADFDKVALAACLKDIEEGIKQKKHDRCPVVIVPGSNFYTGLEDKDQNEIHRFVSYKAQVEDVIKALRRKGVTARVFEYNRENWEKDNQDKQVLTERLDTSTNNLNAIARSAFSNAFVTLMHMKILRAYIDGVLRFGIPATFLIALLVPRKSYER